MRSLLCLLGMALLLLAGPAQAAPTSDYSVNLVITSGRSVRQGKLFVSKGLARIETTDAKGRQTLVILNENVNVIYTVLTATKTIMERPLGPDDGILAGSKPKDTPRQLMGTETVDGQQCEKYKYSTNRHAIFVWLNKDSQIPVQMLTDDNKFKATYSNAAPGPQPASLFVLPSDYKRMQSKDNG